MNNIIYYVWCQPKPRNFELCKSAKSLMFMLSMVILSQTVDQLPTACQVQGKGLDMNRPIQTEHPRNSSSKL